MEVRFTLFGVIFFLCGFSISVFGSAFVSPWFMLGLLLSAGGVTHSYYKTGKNF